MDGLRWLLLLFGLLVIVGVYLYSRGERKKKRTPEISEPPIRERLEPSLGSDSDDELVDEYASEVVDELAGAEAPVPDKIAAAPAEETPRKQKIVTLRLVAKKHRTFAGDDLVLSLRAAGMRHGKFGIFHQYVGDDEKKVIFSAASLVEPGSFDLANIKNQTIPGISMFMVLPGPLEGVQAYDRMITAGRELSKALDAELLDESGSTLSIQRERYLREEIIQYLHGIKVA